MDLVVIEHVDFIVQITITSTNYLLSELLLLGQFAKNGTALVVAAPTPLTR